VNEGIFTQFAKDILGMLYLLLPAVLLTAQAKENQ
jgi:hypothetical protein